MSKGVLMGLKDLYYAILQDDPTSGTATYETPVKVSGAIAAIVKPNASSGTLFADDGPWDVATTLGQVSVELNVADLPITVQAALLGHTLTSGVLMRKSTDVPPYVAIGYKTIKSNGHYRFTWLAKGKFMPHEQNNQSKGESVNFNTPTIIGNFVKRDCDDEWERHIDEDNVDYMSSMATAWFNSPYGHLGTDPGTLNLSSVVPTDGASGVAVTSTVVFTFDDALALSTVTTANFLLIDAAGAGVACTISIDSTRKIVTLTPAASLDTSTLHTVVVTTGVQNLAGTSLTAAALSDFTTTA